MIQNMLKIVALAYLTLGIAFQAQSQPANVPSLDTDAWNQLAARAEIVIDEAVASSSSLTILRADLVEWRHNFRTNQDPLRGEIELLNSRLTALGEPIEGESETGELANLRSEINARLLAVEEPFRIAEDALQHAQGLIDQIDAIKDARVEETRATRGPTPLNPINWLKAANLVTLHYSTVSNKIVSVWESSAQREQLFQQLPFFLLWLLLGGLLFTVARPLVAKTADSLMIKKEDRILRGGGFRGLVADAIFPMVGIAVIIFAFHSIQLTELFGQSFIYNLGGATAIIFVANWLAMVLFADDKTALIQSKLGSEWSRSIRRVITWLGWTFALRTVIHGLPLGFGNAQAELAILAFPALVATAILSFQLSHLIGTHLAELAKTEIKRPFSEAVLTGITLLARVAAVVGVVLAIIGYGAAGDYLIFPILYSLALLGAFFAFEAVISGLLIEMKSRGGMSQRSMTTGVIRVLVGALLAITSIPLLALIWGATTVDIVHAWQSAVEGISIGNQRITLTDLLRFVIVFAVGFILTTLIQSILQRSVLPNTKLNAGTQRALITGIGYVGIIISGIVAVSMTNFDFTNIAIVAGALSVGIGFGLQTVVSNFVSGIILLVERPINVGDWIEVGGVSGTVQNVSVRATQIETFDRARVVVPNTDLIGGLVTNWTLENRRGRVIIPIGVAYGSDTKKVEEILLEIADQNDKVLTDPVPAVIFMNFGADALEFELRVILEEVNNMLIARSELNFEIAKRFEEENISIPFPQRDIWVRNAEELLPNNEHKEADG